MCGDFGGIWHDTPEERHWLDWLNKKNFTTLFVDGNHENFDRLMGDEFQIVDFHGGRAHKIRDNVYHLMRGYVFNICDKKIFAFGGALSHDIKDGILDLDDFNDLRDLVRKYNRLTRQGKLLRINHISWWKEEMPDDKEMEFGLKTLKEHNNEVDFIITHCCPQHVASIFSNGRYKPDALTSYFNIVSDNVKFSKWFFGHYHNEETILDKYTMLYNKIIRVV